MSIRKRGNGWQVRVAPFREQTVPSKAAAVRVEGRLKERKALGDLWIEEPSTLGHELDLHWERKQLGGRRGKLSAAGLAFVAANLKAWGPLRDVSVPSLRRAQVEDHITARAKVAGRSAYNELQELKAALREAQARGQRVDPAIFTLTVPKPTPRTGRALTVEELDAIAAWMPEHIKRVVPFCGTVGLRFTEAMQLDESMLRLQDANPSLLIPAWLNKSRRHKPIHLAKAEVLLLREQLLARTPGTSLVFPNLAGAAYSKSGFRPCWVRALNHAGFVHVEKKPNVRDRIVPDVRFHDLRHTATSLMCMAGMRPEHVAARRGDSDGGALVLRLYRHLYPDEVATAVGALDVLLARPTVAEAEAQ